MPVFAYTARDASGQPSTGTLVADSPTHAQQQLRAEGKYPTSIRPVTQALETPAAELADAAANIKVPRDQVINVCEQLAVMIETGVPLADALDCIASNSENPSLKRLVGDLSSRVQDGRDLSSALARHPRSFPRLFVCLIRASEKSGMLSKLLNRGVAYLRDEQETVRRVKGALTYPSVMLAFAITTTIFLLAFVLPKFTVIYANKKAALPMPTQILMTASDFLIGHWMGLITGVVIAVIALMLALRTAPGQSAWHSLQIHLPLLGKMFRKLHLARGLRMIGTMAGAGISLVDCVETARDLTPNSHFRNLWSGVSEQIQAGKQLSEPLFESQLVPRPVTQMLHSGEKSGKLAYVMEHVAGYAERELKEQIANLTRYIEPAMICVMGVIIGGVAMALLLPIFTISRVMSH